MRNASFNIYICNIIFSSSGERHCCLKTEVSNGPVVHNPGDR